jgi:hypothetical protein
MQESRTALKNTMFGSRGGGNLQKEPLLIRLEED